MRHAMPTHIGRKQIRHHKAAPIDGEAASTRTRPAGATPQRCPIFGRGVPTTTIAPTTSSQNGSTPTPGIASRTSPGKSSHCQPSTTNSSVAVTTSTAHPIGGAKLAKAPMTSDIPAMTKASASRIAENLRGAEAAVSIDRFSNPEGAEGSDILTVALRLVGSGTDDTPPSAPRNAKPCRQNCHKTQRPRHFLAPMTDSVSTMRSR